MLPKPSVCVEAWIERVRNDFGLRLRDIVAVHGRGLQIKNPPCQRSLDRTGPEGIRRESRNVGIPNKSSPRQTGCK
jgi:hypothetical protein